jgi:hypothetical protein
MIYSNCLKYFQLIFTKLSHQLQQFVLLNFVGKKFRSKTLFFTLRSKWGIEVTRPSCYKEKLTVAYFKKAPAVPWVTNSNKYKLRLFYLVTRSYLSELNCPTGRMFAGISCQPAKYTQIYDDMDDYEYMDDFTFLMFCWPCLIIYQYSETNVMHFLFSLLRIKGLYMFRALLAHLQEALNKWHLV